ncbi:MAG: hypothetical protein AAGA48_13255 [Myxococcota bacterium]
MGRWLVISLFAGLVGCPTSIEGTEEECGLTYDSLEGRTFVMLEPVDQDTRENALARVSFEKNKDGQLVSKYTVASLSDVYDYPCELVDTPEKTEMHCFQEPDVVRWCTSLMVADEVCSKKVLRKYDVEGTDEELNNLIKKTRAEIKKVEGTPEYDRFRAINNNVGNKLQGRIYVDIDDKKCRLTISDSYWTIVNGRAMETANIVGRSPFVETKDDYIFESCNEVNVMAGLESKEYPSAKAIAEIPQARNYEKGKAYWWQYLLDSNIKPEDGCSYDFDLYANWKQVASNQKAEIEGSEIRWRGQHAFSEGVHRLGDRDKPLAIVNMVRYKTCADGKREKLDVVCEAGRLMEAGAVPAPKPEPTEGE